MIELLDLSNLAFLPMLAAALPGVSGAAAGAGAGAGWLSSVGNFLGGDTFKNILGGIGGLFGGGGGVSASQLSKGRNDIMNLPGMQGPVGFNTGFGTTGAGGFSGSGLFNAQQAMLGGMSQGLLGGGMFNDTGFQQALQGNDLTGALGQANNAWAQQMGPTAFGGLGGLNQQAGQMAGMFGGMVPSMMQMGMQNQMAAGNQQGLFDQSLASQRAAFAPVANQQFNKLQDTLFAQGRLGSTGGAENMRGLFEAQNQADLGFQNNAFNQMQQQQQFLGNLGAQQFGQAGQFGQQAQGFMGQQGGFEQQAFNQFLSALQQNQSAGQQRLTAAQGLFGQGADIFASQFGLGLGAQDTMNSMNNLALQAGRAPWELQAGLLGSGGQHADALSKIATTKTGGGGLLGGLFSDRRLKKNLTKLGTINGLNWYAWDWNELAHEVGADQQPSYGVIAQEVEEVMPEAVRELNGYKQVNYEKLLGLGA